MKLIVEASISQAGVNYGKLKCALCGKLSQSMLAASRHLRLYHPKALAAYREEMRVEVTPPQKAAG